MTLQPGRYVAAVSGGVDSVVLLDLLSKQEGIDLIVAHFDHGIRSDSHEDAQFVEGLALAYGFPFETRREELGHEASEEYARDRRYVFLRHVSKKYNAPIITAHHADDVAETIAINLTRGTGWRGLAVLDSDIIRPLLHTFKDEILSYAKEHAISWHEDSTNRSDVYLRNRMRSALKGFDLDTKLQLLALWSAQTELKKDIEIETKQLLRDDASYSRYFFTHIDQPSVLECIRAITQAKLTRPQMGSVLLAIKTAKPGKTLQAGNGVELDFSSRNFTVKLIK